MQKGRNGDEVGAEFLPYDEQAISWNDRHGLTPLYQRLVQLRKKVGALSSPELELISTNRDDAVLAYVRPAATSSSDGARFCGDSRAVLVLLNFSNEAIDLRLPLQGAVSSILDGSELQDLLANRYIPTASDGSIRLKPFDARVLSRARHPSDEPCSA